MEFNIKAKYLGVIIDNKLTWCQHIENIKNKIIKGIGILKKMCYFLQEDKLVSKDTLKRTLNKAMRIMAFRSKYESAKSLYIYYKILPLEANIKLNQGKFIWKLTQNQHPDCIQAIYQTNSSTAINNKKGNNRFILPSFRTIGRASLAYKGIKLWNKGIPETIKKSTKYSSFSKELKQHLLEENNLILSND